MTEIRRHVYETKGFIPAGKTKILPLLWHIKGEPVSTTLPDSLAETTKIYPSGELPDKSRASRMYGTWLIKPKVPTDSGHLDYYTGTIATSFHDLKSQEIYGMGITDDDVPVWEITRGTQTKITQSFSPDIAMNQQVYMATDTLKHWWYGFRKRNLIQQGGSHGYQGPVFIPRKCIRSNRGMFFGQVFMNDSDVDLAVEVDINFTEIPINLPVTPTS